MNRGIRQNALTNKYQRVGKRIRIQMFDSKFEFSNFIKILTHNRKCSGLSPELTHKNIYV